MAILQRLPHLFVLGDGDFFGDAFERTEERAGGDRFFAQTDPNAFARIVERKKRRLNRSGDDFDLQALWQGETSLGRDHL